ncbi:12784_t:CDS:2, partial [Funneliformis caledonium]
NFRRYPRLAKCLEPVEREISTPISFNLSATDPAEIEGCLRMHYPIARDQGKKGAH